MKKLLSLLLTVSLLASLCVVFSVTASAAEPLSARGYSVPDNETEGGWEHEYCYVVFSKDVKAPDASIRLAVVGNWTYSNFAYVTADIIEVISPRMWRFTNKAYLDAAKEGSNSFYDQLNLADGFYPRAGVTNLQVRIFGNVEATDGEKLVMIEDVYDDTQPVNHEYPQRVHFKQDGTDFDTGYNLNWSLVESVASITPAPETTPETTPATKPETKPEEKPEEKPDNPKTADVLTAVSVLALVGLAGVVIAKKH